MKPDNKKILISLPNEVKELASKRIRFFGNFSAYVAHLIDNDLANHGISSLYGNNNASINTSGDVIQIAGNTKGAKAKLKSKK